MSDASFQERMGMFAPEYLGAGFEGGPNEWYRNIIPLFDVRQKGGRDLWAYMNLRVFTNGKTVSPELQWFPALAYWINDLETAAANMGLSEKELEEARRDIKAMMGVAAAGVSMEASAGDPDPYVRFISLSMGREKPDLDVQDRLRDKIIHENPEMLNRVLALPLVRHYYDILLEDAGFDSVREWTKVGKNWLPSKFSVDVTRASRGRLVARLSSRDTNAEYGGFDAYVNELLERDARYAEQLIAQGEPPPDIWVNPALDPKGYTKRAQWGAAKLACYAFLIDKYTRWEMAVDPTGKNLKLKPAIRWGGDPLRSVLEPSFLPDIIKDVWPGLGKPGEKEVFKLLNMAFRPEDIPGVADKLLTPSMVVHLKMYARYESALYGILGASMAPLFPSWREEVLTFLPTMADLLYQVYGITIGKEIVGTMIARVLFAKATATALETPEPALKEMGAAFREAAEGAPRQARGEEFRKAVDFLVGKTYLYGDKDFREGWLANLESVERSIVFNPEARKMILDTMDLLLTGSRDKRKQGWMLLAEALGGLARAGFDLERSLR